MAALVLGEAPERVDLCDAAGHALGRAKARDDVHRDGDWHRSAHIWIYTSKGRLLFQQRAPYKEIRPGRLGHTVGGHCWAREGLAGMVHEAGEELGVAVNLDELVPLGVRRAVSPQPGVIDREIQDIYLLRPDLPLIAYHSNPDEIDELALLDAEETPRLHAGTIEQTVAEVLPRGATTIAMRTITPADIISGRGDYPATLTRAVGDALAGRAPQPLQLADNCQRAART
jgi:isopentenyldiphosphate isomerase